jgi:hypothetical protein
MTLQIVWNASTVTPGLHHGRHLLRRVISRIREAVCALHGHDAMLHFERGRMSLQCVTCGHETPGWTVGPGGVHSAETGAVSGLRKTAAAL